ncbi:hypothetical protein [Streptomyces virginiae]|uniref:hypothetical protein n=1 Tax=Streptomyces virginiae TaxID=1961 RepID=UPI0034164614
MTHFAQVILVYDQVGLTATRSAGQLIEAHRHLALAGDIYLGLFPFVPHHGAI